MTSPFLLRLRAIALALRVLPRMRSAYMPQGRLHGFEDSCVAGAPALIARQGLANIFGFIGVFEVVQRRQNHAGSTHTALRTSVFVESALNRVKHRVIPYSFDGDDVLPLNLA